MRRKTRSVELRTAIHDVLHNPEHSDAVKLEIIHGICHECRPCRYIPIKCSG